ncbi:TATA element modulatory factor 1, partial [Coemansia sp. RSA 922]
MNGLFGGVPIGPAGKQSGSASRQPPASNAAANRKTTGDTSNAGSSPASGLGGWGNMFKTALSQVETHLDRYLEIPNPADTQPQLQSRSRSPAAPRAIRGTRLPGGATAPVSLDSVSRPQSRATAAVVVEPRPASSMGRSATPVSANNSASTTVPPPSATVDVVDEDLDSDLLEAFGVELDQPSSKEQSSVARGSKEIQRRLDADEDQANSSGDSTDSLAALEQITLKAEEIPYIQAELSKLRSATLPTDAEGMRATISEYAKRIEDLLLEGQQWSTKELRLSSSIKKLRADNKSLERAAQLTQKKLDSAVAKSEDLAEKLKRTSVADRSSADNAKALMARLSEGESQRLALEREVKAAVEARNSLRAALSTSEHDATALRAELASVRARHHAETQRAREGAAEEAARQVSELKAGAAAAQTELRAQLGELQQRIMVVEEDARDREVAALTQIRALQAQARGAEAHRSELGAEIQLHTLPLLQQIEDMRAQKAELRQAWARTESDWAARLRKEAKDAESLSAQLEARAADVASARKDADAEAKRREEVQAEVARLQEQLLVEAKMRADLKLQLEDAHDSVRRLTGKLDALASLRAAWSEGNAAARSASASLPMPPSRASPMPHDATLAAALSPGLR